MSSAISGIGEVRFDAANSSVKPAVPQQVVATSNVQEDTVQLTVGQRVSRLYRQGQSVAQIAASLSLSVAVVESYLEISSAA